GLHAFVAARAFIQVEQEQVLALHQLLFEKVAERSLLHSSQDLEVHLPAPAADLTDPGRHLGKGLQHFGELLGATADELDETDGGAGGGAVAALERVLRDCEGRLADDEALSG